jgi:tape measure domain-containing protein
MDIAQLGFRIRSQDADTAHKRLDRMAGSAGRAEREAKDMGRAFGVAANDTRNLGRQFDYTGDQARRTERDFERISQTSNMIGSAMRMAAVAVLGFAGAFSVREIAQMAEGYSLLGARIALFNENAIQSADVMSNLDRSAYDLGVPLEALSEIYLRLAPAQRELGYTTGQLLTITDSIATSMVVSGASAAEAEGAIRQLAQGLAAGALRGDEFNSVSEQAPRLMRVLSDHLGVSTGALRSMAAEGEITARVVGDALLGASEDLRAELDRLPATLERASNSMRNEFGAALAALDSEMGVMRSIAGHINSLASEMRSNRLGVEFIGMDRSQIESEIAGIRDLIDAIEETEDGAWRARARARGIAVEILGNETIRDLRDQGLLAGDAYVEGLIGALEARIEQGRSAMAALVVPVLPGSGGASPVSAAQRAVDDYVEALEREHHAMALGRREREQRLALLAIEKHIQDPTIEGWERLTDAQEEELRTALRINRLWEEQTRMYDNIRSSVDRYADSVRALEGLMGTGAITAAEYWDQMLGQGLVRDSRLLDVFLRSQGGEFAPNAIEQALGQSENPFAGLQNDPLFSSQGEEIIRLQDRYAEQRRILDQMREADIVSFEGYQQRLTALQDAGLAERIALERNAHAVQVGAAETMFGGLSELTRAAFGEQSAAYKAMFFAEKGLALARAWMLMEIATMQAAASAPPPLNVPAIALARAQGIASIASIAAQAISGFYSGGYTGDGPLGQVAGFVHGQEGVLNHQAMRGIGRQSLDYMNRNHALPPANDSRGNTVAFQFDMRGAVVTEELLQQINRLVEQGKVEAIATSTKISARNTQSAVANLARPQISAGRY